MYFEIVLVLAGGALSPLIAADRAQRQEELLSSGQMGLQSETLFQINKTFLLSKKVFL